MGKPLKDYLDSFGMLGKIWHKDGRESGGDSAQRMGMYHSGMKFLDHYDIKASSAYTDGPKTVEDAISGLFRQNGTWRRHPDENRWYGDWDRMSRDQSIPIIVMLGAHKKWSVLGKTFFHHLFCRGLLFMTNIRRNWATPENHNTPDPDGDLYNYDKKIPDITFVEHLSLYIRCLPLGLGYLFYPLLMLADCMTLVGALIRNNNDDKDVLNHCIIAVNATINYPTPIGWLANKLTNWDLMAKKLSDYFSEASGDPPLHRIWIPLILRLK